MNQIFLTQAIDNTDGYVDNVVSQIKAVKQGEGLEMLITCEGGDVYQGARLHRAILEHDGETKASVIGLAASMGCVLLSAFDSVELDSEIDLMLHKARIPYEDNPSDEQIGMIARFNRIAHSRMMEKGVDSDLLDKVFLSDSTENVWLNAKEAEAAGIGKVVKIERRNSTPFKVAASLDINSIKNKFNKQMGLFDKPVMRAVTLTDGRVVVFNSKNENIQKGDKLSLVGSNDSLKGSIRINAKLVAQIGVDNVVEAVTEEEAPKSVVSDDQLAEMAQRITDIEQAIQGILEKLGADEEKEVKEDAGVTQAQAALDEKTDELKKATDSVKALLTNAMEVAKTISTGFKLAKPEDKHEPMLAGLTAKQIHTQKLRQAVNAK